LTYSKIKLGVLLCEIVSKLTESKAKWTYLRVPHDVEQCDNVWPTRQVLEDLDLTLYLLLLDRLQDLDDTFLVVGDIDALEYLRVLSAAFKNISICTSFLLTGCRCDAPIFLTTS
jgi:hypothetical protein